MRINLQKFTDINTSNHLTSILIANDWGVIQVYPDATFKSNTTITIEETMTMYPRAMELAKILENRADKLDYFMILMRYRIGQLPMSPLDY